MTIRLLFIFIDGLGLGSSDPDLNPLAGIHLPQIHSLLEGRQLVASSAPFWGAKATLLALDACLGVAGLPQSATGQAVLLTGRNIPAEIGYHYGPKPNPEIANHLINGNLFSYLKAHHLQAELLNAYPPSYFEAIASGRRLYSAIPLAATIAGIALKTQTDLIAGQAIAADLTGQGWHTHLGLTEVPILTSSQAGRRMQAIAMDSEFSFFEYWLSDYAGHRRDKTAAIELLIEFDQLLSGLLATWEYDESLILITSDHGNLENLATRRHTRNPVPALVIGDLDLRTKFCQNLTDITDITPAIIDLIIPDHLRAE